MGRFARRIVGLQDVFPSSDRSIVAPDQVDGVVSPVFQFPSAAAALDRAIRTSQTSTSVVTPSLNLGTLGQGVFEEWIYASVFHDSATERQIALNIVDPAGAAVQVGRFSVPPLSALSIVNATANGVGQIFNLPIRVWVPGGFAIVVQGDTAGAAYAITIQRVLVVHPQAEAAVWP